MVHSLRETRGLIVDLRNGTQTLAAVSRLAKRTTIVERDRRPIVSLQEESDPQSQPVGGFLESTVTLEKPLEPYKGIVVGLIDEYCQSELEHGAIGLKVAADAVLIGSATAGALWYANRFSLPGHIQVTFSGGDARWPDGRRIQRVGVLPDIPVNATIEGIRTGRDEVLEKAVEYLRSRR